MEIVQSHPDLERMGFTNLNMVYLQLHTPQLYEQTLRRQEGFISHLGPLVVRTGDHTGRSPNDKFVVQDELTKDSVWWGKINQEFSSAQFDRLFAKLQAYFQGKNAFIQDCFVGTDPEYKMPIRVITETAWHSLFARNMFVRATEEELTNFSPEFTLFHAPGFHAIPEYDGTNSTVFIVINFAKKLVLIGGSSYAGEMKKAMFSVMNFSLPKKGVLSMHCSANQSPRNDVALFFGLSGTGKTTLSADTSRILIGDDEHGWSEHGVFNFEGGCYAKVIRLSPTGEPEIYDTTRRFGTILENVAMDMNSRRLDLNDATFTENTRASYPISHIPNATRQGTSGHPQNIIFLTADAFGILPPVSRLTPEQAMYHFISGYTAKVAGTEKGVTEPQTTFSACFGAPFLPMHPTVYAELLREKLNRHKAQVWLVNTGWTSGPYGVGHRMELGYTRAIVSAILNGELTGVEMDQDPIFGLYYPRSVGNIPSEILNPRNTWEDPEAYDKKATELAQKFKANFEVYAAKAGEDVVAAGPKV